MFGGGGDDTFFVDNVGDSVNENFGDGTDLVNSSISYSLSFSFIENLTLTGTADIDGAGSTFDNVIHGNSGNNILTGDDGADRLFGGAGNDTLTGGNGYDRTYGGTGDDTYYVNDAWDFAYENAGEGHDTVIASVDHTLRANVEDLTLVDSAIVGKGNAIDNAITGDGNDNKLYGLDGNDTLHGGIGADYLAGGNGADTLDGGTGRDTLVGGAGNDTFVFADGDFGGATRATADRITDFASGDKIDLSAVDANTLVAGDQGFSFIGTGAFTHTAGELRYEQISGNTYVSGDTNGDGVADFMIKLDGLHALTGTDLVP
jgi:Ca2+-binding RTX toxin-like protein